MQNVVTRTVTLWQVLVEILCDICSWVGAKAQWYRSVLLVHRGGEVKTVDKFCERNFNISDKSCVNDCTCCNSSKLSKKVVKYHQHKAIWFEDLIHSFSLELTRNLITSNQKKYQSEYVTDKAIKTQNVQRGSLYFKRLDYFCTCCFGSRKSGGLYRWSRNNSRVIITSTGGDRHCSTCQTKRSHWNKRKNKEGSLLKLFACAECSGNQPFTCSKAISVNETVESCYLELAVHSHHVHFRLSVTRIVFLHVMVVGNQKSSCLMVCATPLLRKTSGLKL